MIGQDRGGQGEGSGSIVLGAVGDIGLIRGVLDVMGASGFDAPFAAMAPQLVQADLLFGNFETVLVPGDYPRGEIRSGTVVAPIPGEECAAALRRAGFGLLNLAQNHILDAGVVGLTYTRNVLEASGIATAGVGESQQAARQPRIVEAGGVRVGFLCYCEDNNYTLGVQGTTHAYFEIDTVLEDLAALRPLVDIAVVSVHADLEFLPTPSPGRREAFRRLARAGADLVLGHHPHVPQGCERLGRSLIAYSLGNFIFPAHSSPYMRSAGPDTAWSFLLLVRLSKAGVEDFERVPFAIGRAPSELPVPLDGDDREAKLRRLRELDALAQDDQAVASVWREAALRKLKGEVARIGTMGRQPMPGWLLRLGRRLGLITSARVDAHVESVLDELVGRLWLTAENRAWMDEVVAAAEERWQARNAGPQDQLHRPKHGFDLRK